MPKTRHYYRASKDRESGRPQKGLRGRKKQIALEETALMDLSCEVKSWMEKTKKMVYYNKPD